MEHWQLESCSDAPRSLIVSLRANNSEVWRCPVYEFEDLIAGFESADIVSLKPQAVSSNLRRIGLKLVERQTAGRWTLAPRYRPVKDTRYDLALFSCGNVWDLMTRTGRIQDFTRLADFSVCYIHELWASRLPLKKEFIQRLQQFDAIFLAAANTVDGLSKQTGRPCYHVPLGVDTLAACPYPDPPQRCVDVLSFGRRVPAIHDRLKEHAEQHDDFFYVRDTVKGLGIATVADARDHRQQLMAMLKRSKYCIANRPKIDQPTLTKTESEVGGRFYEGAAAGCVMIGAPPTNDEFAELFDWPDAVIPNPENADHFVDLLSELEGDAARLQRIRIDGVVNCLRRHDWAYRWKAILDHVGLRPRKALEARINALEQRADQVG